MYLSFFIVLFLLVLSLVLIWRRKIAVKKVCTMKFGEKTALLNSVLEPFGYTYDLCKDVISSHNDAWQRHAGYTAAFNHAALHFHMVFDTFPIYFYYRGRTWLIELWKGQYGINTGAEVGIYYTDSLVDNEDLPTTHFTAVNDDDRLPVCFTLYRHHHPVVSLSQTTWWLTAFLPGLFSNPGGLSLEAVIYFPNYEMQHAFLKGLDGSGYPKDAVHCHGRKICIHFDSCCHNRALREDDSTPVRRLYIKIIQTNNALFCRLYIFITRPFTCTLDRLVYLYLLLPAVLRRMLRHLRGSLRS